ncbi:MAG: acetolactate synthase small subunit [Oscillospiraceae bacterium]|jgi:acetolactate synthase-1/3 small subunit|nr:acetolactate synthase small subunit [Oscillospiraceae bacterium]
MERDNYLLITTHNNTGILQRITGLFSRRFYNILSTVAAQDVDSEFSHLIIVVRGDENVVRQVEKQVSKLHDVLEVEVLDPEHIVLREHLMLKLARTEETDAEMVAIANLFRANILNVGQDTMILELSGSPKTLNSLINLCKPFGILQLLRTGAMAMSV